jgi:hypothetical protein
MKRNLLISIVLLVIMCMFIMGNTSGCESETPVSETSSFQEASKTNEANASNIIKNDTLPTVTKSLERENIKRRIEFINQPDRIGYLYLLTENGQLIREIQVLGKVSSLNSYLTPMEDIQWFKGTDVGDSWGDVPIVTSAPDLDGTYGSNAEGIFWFTPDGVYQESIGGISFYSSERLTFTTKPLLVEEVK